ncbi:glycoside hydrolase family 15 protein [Herbivorax sp. ANBcel31]|uniref:glycoside hydrolase family 15 protein n=1 Tax=Herbivorax sp. ANBcel31 TaxID=3069754 RepID=UPI0027AFFDA6|nr:glycoside hydrolase family 15 protein [Herbivorax sp. ANBcel31]MDQ2084886.1 glycoside hydrolase family 15 protein [Herbivorax sp. ANBcel31]
MSKTYFNDAIVGNSRMLGCLTKRGELTRLFWPNIDYPQHIDKMVAGIFLKGHKNSTSWFGEDNWNCTQTYIEDTNILKKIYSCKEKSLKIEQKDFVLKDKDILIRNYTIENIGQHEVDLGFVQYSSCISTISELGSTLFDFDTDALIHYRHGYYISISSDYEVFQFQLGNNAFDCAKHTELNGYENIGMMKDGALSWELGKIIPGENKIFNLYICASNTLKEAKKLVKECKRIDFEMEFDKTKRYWFEFLKSSKQIITGNSTIDRLYKRSLLVFKLMADEKTGGLLASAEVDEEFTKCGRYGYCWGRDAAFITDALDVSGLIEDVDKFYNWAVMTQEDDGSWHQRYYMDGNLAPSWGIQIDEVGALIFGMVKHYENTKDKNFIAKMWNSITCGVEFLIGFIDIETGLPKPSYDLWEERVGEHAYSSAAVYGGIKAGVSAAKILNAPFKIIEKWDLAAKNLKIAIEQNLWKPQANRFLRSVKTKLNPWGSEHSNHTTVVTVNSKGYKRDVTLEDYTIDVSLLGLIVPFKVFDAKDQRVVNTVRAIEKALTSHPVGGIKRYENDGYIGGNPWVLTTLWLALYYIEIEEYERAKEYFNWAVKARTQLDLLPEQVSKDNGEPCWVIPLTWSHAMFVLVLEKLKRTESI